MPRTKGSKNKTNKSVSIDEKIKQVTEEIEALNATIAEKKAEIKELKKQKDESDKQRVLDAFLKSGKSVEEIMNLISGKTVVMNQEE